jgi:hypothetical protein
MASIQTAYEWAIEKCNAPNIGYSQAYRNQRTVNGITIMIVRHLYGMR